MVTVQRAFRANDANVFVPPLPRDLAYQKARIIAAVKNIDAPMLTRVWQNLNIVSMCAVSPVVHTSNISSCIKKKFSFPVAVNNSIKVGPVNVRNHGEHCETPCISQHPCDVSLRSMQYVSMMLLGCRIILQDISLSPPKLVPSLMY